MNSTSNSLSPNDSSTARSGVLAVIGAFLIWGLLPLYLKPLHAVPAITIVAWRTIMGLILIVTWLYWRGELGQVKTAFRNPRTCGLLFVTATLLTLNWGTYAWGVTHGQVLITSLGYFINPLGSVLLGVLVLGERLNRPQWAAVALAAVGVTILSLGAESFPWLAFALATTFGLYGLLRKMAPVPAMPGVAVETLLITPLALAWLWWSAPQQGGLFNYSPFELTLLLCCGLVTIVPLGLFNHGARLINYATVGMMQYIAPSLQFLIGLLVYREPLSMQRLLCFVLIWSGLGIYAADLLWRARRPVNVTE